VDLPAERSLRVKSERGTIVEVRRKSRCSFRETTETPGGPVTEWFGTVDKAKGRAGAAGVDVGVDDDGGCCGMDAGQRTRDTFVRGGKGDSPGGVLARAPAHSSHKWLDFHLDR